MIKKGKCLECQFCSIHDNGRERQLHCLQTKRGRVLTWTMHTGEARNGVFIPDSTEKLGKRLIDYMKNRIPPKWCVYRKQEQEQTVAENELKPCPLCGATEEVNLVSLGVIFWCECEMCGAKSAAADTREEAVAYWNQRRVK